MSQNWVPPDISSICSESVAPLTQCSQIGFMYLSLLSQLFGRSIDSVYKNPYSNYQSAVNFGPEIGPAQFRSTQPIGPITLEPVPIDPEFQGPLQFGPQNSYSLLGPKFGTKATGLGPVLQTDFSINYNTKIQSHGPEGSRGYSAASFYLKPDPFLESKSDFKFEFETPRNQFDYNLINKRSLDTEATDTKIVTVTEKIEKKESKQSKSSREYTPNEEKKSRKKRQAVEEYDFIIVGAGSAGCVMANRLSEVKKWKVLLLEAGPEEPEVTSVPALAPALARSSIDWMYRTQPEELSCRAQRDQSCAWVSGKVMGGSSAINYLVYMRGNKRDYDDWADLGNYGWSYREVLPYFRKSENNKDVEAKDFKHHGTGGPLNVERFGYQDKNVGLLVNAFHETGLPFVDFNGEKQIGTMTVQNTSKNGKRHSANVAFIRSVRYKRKNLVIVTKAQVTKVLIHPRKKIAYGVKYFRQGIWHEVHAKKEVIISAGAIGSPKILMLSGIGPKDYLKTLKIPLVKDLNVGRNLQDHVTTDAMLMKLSNKTSTLIQGKQILKDIFKYPNSKQKSVPLSATGILQMSAFIKTNNTDGTAPNIQFHFDGRNYREFYEDPTTYLASNKLPLSYYDSINVRPVLLVPKSKGFITLNTTDPIFGLPMIYPRFFTVKEDLDTLVSALRFVVKLEDTKAFRLNGVTFIKKPVKACANYKWGSDEYFACLFTRYTTTIFHPSGTCKMGPAKDVDAVVDPRLKVYGIRHMRVADNSIMPNIVRGNTNAPAIMIGEKASDMVKEDWKHFL